MKLHFCRTTCFLMLLSSTFLSQQKNNSPFTQTLISNKRFFTKSNDIFGTRTFIENKGQFNGKIPGSEKVLFLYDHGSEKIYFTPKGLVYEFTKEESLSEREREERESGNAASTKAPETYVVHMNWLRANEAGTTVVPSEKQSYYFTYGGPEYNSSPYKKLTYQNVYPNIDIEYSIPEDKERGIKYSVILHPGAVAENVKLLYSGDVKKIKLNDKGEVLIKTALESLIEHAPYSYYDDKQTLLSEFQLQGDTIMFIFPEGRDKNKTLIVDPWVTTVTTMIGTNSAYDVDYDFGGNTFIYGGGLPNKIAMYNSAGSLQWTFGGSVVSPAWSNVTCTSNFGVDKLSGKSFAGQGVVSAGAQVIRINNNGNYDNFISTPNGQYREIWEMGFHCLTGEVFIFGGSTAGNLSAATINSVTAGLNISTFQPTNAVCCQDIASHAIDDQGNIFVIYASGNPSMSNRICFVNPTFNGNMWTVPSGYVSLNENGNKVAYQPPVTSNGFNCLAVNGNFLYYYDGLNLAAYSKSTGANIASTTTGLTLKRQGGIAVDDCNHIYIGGTGSILTYSFNGTSFSTLTPIPLGVNTPTQNVQDIKLDRNTKTLFVCGTGFVGTYSATLSYTCGVPMGLCVFNQAGIGASTSSITCATLGSATVTPNGGLGPYSYTWVPSGQLGPIATGLSPGTYTVVVYDAGYNATYTATTTFVSPVPLSGNLSTSFMLPCAGVNTGTAAILNLSGGSGNQTYVWSNGVTTQTSAIATGLSAGNYTVTVTDALTGCVLSPTFTIFQPAALNAFISASSPSACLNNTIGLSVFNSGGVSPYTYSWTTGSTLGGIAVNQAAQGTYSYALNVKDQNNCLTSASITVDYIPYPAVTVSNFSICPLQTGTLIANGASTYTWTSATLSVTGSTFTDNPIVSTQYTITGSALSCESTTTGSIILKPVPVPVFSSNSPICNGQALHLSATTSTASIWTGPASYTSVVVNPTLTPAAPINSGVYHVTVTAANSCTATTQGTVTIHPTPTLTALGSTVCVTQTVNLSANSFAGANYVWTGPNNFTSLQQNPSISNPPVSASGNYTVKATSVPGCTNTAIANVTVTALPVVSFTSNSPQCFGNTLSFNANATTGGLIYNWLGPNGFNSLQQNPFISNVTVPASGSYTLTVTTGPCVVSANHTATIHPLPAPFAFNSSPACEGKSFQLGVNNCGVSYQWFGPNGFSSTFTAQTLSNVTLSQGGIYTVTVIDANTCQNVSTTSVTILQNPTVHASGELVCFGEPAQLNAVGAANYYWMGPANFTANITSPIVAPTINTQVWTYTVIGTAINGCTAVASTTVGTRVLPIPTITVTPRVCVKSDIKLQALGGQLYQWTGPLGYNSTLQNPSFVAWNSGYTGTYSLMVTDLFGCKGYTTALVTIDPEPGGALIGDHMSGCVPFCSNYSLQATNAISITNTSWQIAGQNFSSPSFSYCFTKAGDYEVKGSFENEHNCRGNVNVMIQAYALPEADFEYSPVKPIENEGPVIFTNTSRGDYQNKWHWAFINNQGYTSNVQNTAYTFDDAGYYVVALLVENKYGCKDTVLKTIEVLPDFHVYIPNAFTPNDDGLNDYFFPVMRGVKKYTIQIFERWGELIFASDDPSHNWNGSYKGKPCEEGIYSWSLFILTNKGEEKKDVGSVMLYR